MAVAHERCYRGPDGILSLPPSECGWEAHQAAVEEHGYCPVCQHDEEHRHEEDKT